MPVHVEEVTSEVTLIQGELPLSEAQLEQIAAYVLRCLDERERARAQARDATVLRTSVEPPVPGAGG